jgi:hypothetical protein
VSERDTRSDYEPWLEQAATVAAAGMPLGAGVLLLGGRFRIDRTLGTGGMGVVYAAQDLHMQRQVALKSLVYRSSTDIYQLKREFRALADLNHRNLVNLYELFADGELWFFTMELIEGDNLFRYLRHAPPPAPQTTVRDRSSRTPHPGNAGPATALPAAEGPVDYDRVRAVFGQFAEGVVALHAAGKLHRDLKPHNVMVTDQGRVQILDFGLTLEVLDKSADFAGFAGTPLYMAPEQVDGKSVGNACDWYAFGVMLYEVLCGQLPFQGRVTDILTQKRSQDPVPLAVRAPDAPVDLCALCADLMARDPSRRPDGAEVLPRLGVTRIEAGRSLQRPAGQEGPKLVGRQAELQLLRQAFSDVRGGRTRAVFVHGHSGMGKTRVIEQFLAELDTDAAVVLSGRCYERESVPYKAFDTLVDALSRHLEPLSDANLGALLPKDVQTIVRVFPVLGRIAGVARRDRNAAPIPDAQVLRRRAFAALKELLHRISEQRPLVLFIDDLQWGDEDGAALFAALLAAGSTPRMLVLGSYRSDEAEASPFLRALARDPHAPLIPRIEVGALSPDEAEELAHRQLSDAHDPGRGLSRAIAAEADGNAFFVSALVEHCLAADNPNTAHASGLTLAQVIDARSARLSEGARRLLRVVALAGTPIGQQLALGAAGLGGDPEAVAILRNDRLIRTHGGGSMDAVECYHDRIRERICAALAHPEAIALHLALAETLERSEYDHPELITEQFLAAEQPARAAPHAVAAAQAAAAALAFDRAIQLYETALSLCTEAAQRALLTREYGQALINGGRQVDGAAQLVAAAALSEGRVALDLRRQAAHELLVTGNFQDGAALLRQVVLATGLPYPESDGAALRAVIWRAVKLKLHGSDYRARPGDQLDERARLQLDVAWSAGWSLSFLDTLRFGLFTLEFMLRALRSGDANLLARAEATLGVSLVVKSDRQYREALAHLERPARLASDPHARAYVLLSEAGIHGQCFGFRECLAAADAAVPLYADHVVGANYEIVLARVWGLIALTYCGEFRELARRVPDFVAQYQGRRDAHAQVQGATYELVVRMNQDADVESAVEKVQRAIAALPPAVGAIFLPAVAQGALYLGRLELAEEVMARFDADIRAHGDVGVRYLSQVETGLRHGHVQLALAQARRGKERQAALAKLRRHAAWFERQRADVPRAYGLLLRAAEEVLHDRPERALPVLREAVDVCGRAGLRNFEAHARYKLSSLVDGAESEALRRAAQDYFEREGVSNVQRWQELLGFVAPAA